MTATGQVIEAGAGAKATLEAVQNEFRNAKFAGIACGIKNTGIGNGMPDSSMVKIAIAAEDKVIIDHGWTEMGQGRTHGSGAVAGHRDRHQSVYDRGSGRDKFRDAGGHDDRLARHFADWQRHH